MSVASSLPDPTRIEAIIVSFIREELLGGRAEAIDTEENLLTSGYVDSVGIMRLVMHVETTLAIKIPPAELVPQNFRTIRGLAAYLARKLSPDPGQSTWST